MRQKRLPELVLNWGRGRTTCQRRAVGRGRAAAVDGAVKHAVMHFEQRVRRIAHPGSGDPILLAAQCLHTFTAEERMWGRRTRVTRT